MFPLPFPNHVVLGLKPNQTLTINQLFKIRKWLFMQEWFVKFLEDTYKLYHATDRGVRSKNVLQSKWQKLCILSSSKNRCILISDSYRVSCFCRHIFAKDSSLPPVMTFDAEKLVNAGKVRHRKRGRERWGKGYPLLSQSLWGVDR